MKNRQPTCRLIRLFASSFDITAQSAQAAACADLLAGGLHA
jgi:hypothetical protein